VVAVLLSPDGLVIAQERNGRPFRNAGLRPIQMSNPNVLGILIPLGAAEQEWVTAGIERFGQGRQQFCLTPSAPASPIPSERPPEPALVDGDPTQDRVDHGANQR